MAESSISKRSQSSVMRFCTVIAHRITSTPPYSEEKEYVKSTCHKRLRKTPKRRKAAINRAMFRFAVFEISMCRISFPAVLSAHK